MVSFSTTAVGEISLIWSKNLGVSVLDVVGSQFHHLLKKSYWKAYSLLTGLSLSICVYDWPWSLCRWPKALPKIEAQDQRKLLLLKERRTPFLPLGSKQLKISVCSLLSPNHFVLRFTRNAPRTQRGWDEKGSLEVTFFSFSLVCWSCNHINLLFRHLVCGLPLPPAHLHCVSYFAKIKDWPE